MKACRRWSLVALAWCQFASTAQAQQLGGAQSDDISLWRVLATLLLCLALAVGAAFALRYRMTGRFDFALGNVITAKRMVLIERLRFGPHAELCLVAIDGQEWLVTATQSSVQIVPHVRDAQRCEGSV